MQSSLALKLWIVIVCLAAVVQPAPTTEILFETNAPNLGIGVYPAGDQEWRSKLMGYPGPVKEEDWTWIGPDFFEAEYGSPCVFTSDWIKAYGYSSNAPYTIADGQMTFRTGTNGFYFGFGGIPKDPTRPGNGFGLAWGRNQGNQIRLRVVLEQDVAKTDWTFQTCNPARYNAPIFFSIAGAGRREHLIALPSLMGINTLFGTTGFRFQCLTTNATVRVESLRIAPSSPIMYFRRKVNLPQAPILAHATFTCSTIYDLYVNDAKVDSGTGIYPFGGVRTVDLARYLKAGENTIAFSCAYALWWGGQPQWLFEGVAVDKSGGTTRILGDANWKCSLAAGGTNWSSASFDDSQWAAPKLADPADNVMFDETRVGRGVNPQHMGMLDAKPDGRDFPVFDFNERIRFLVQLPIGVEGRLTPQLAVYKAGADTLVETLVGHEAAKNGDFIVYRFEPKTREVGPYRLIWKLTETNGTVVETRREELVIVGPIPQDRLGLAEFEGEFEKS